jgi:5-hydroxyisourate hydrolase-like protein (transthyretin family)
MFADLTPPRAIPSPSIDLYLAKESQINFSAIQVPANIKLIDERAGTAGSVIRGQVLDMPSSKPIADAQIVLEKNNKETHKWESAMQTRSNADGEFEFKELPSDSYRLNVSASDHATRVADYIQVLESTFKQTTVQLSALVKITGKVIDNDGAAVVGASVRASGSIAADKTEYRQPEDAPQATTDAQGNFSLLAPPGTTHLYATLDGYFQLYSREATTAPSDAVTIRVTKTGTIKVTVVESAGNPAKDAMVEVRGSPDPIGRWGGSRSMMPDGIFEFKNIPPGEYLVSTGPSPDIANDANAKKIEVKIGQTTEITMEQHARVMKTGTGGQRISPIQ